MTVVTYLNGDTGEPVIIEATDDPSPETLSEMGASVGLALVKVTKVRTNKEERND